MDLTCVICGARVGLRYYLCKDHLEYRNDPSPWVRFLICNAASARMRWLSRAKSRTKMVCFSELNVSDQRSLGIDSEIIR